jgi:hypothetical protein
VVDVNPRGFNNGSRANSGRSAQSREFPDDLLLVKAVLARELAALRTRVDSLDDNTRKQFEQVGAFAIGVPIVFFAVLIAILLSINLEALADVAG